MKREIILQNCNLTDDIIKDITIYIMYRRHQIDTLDLSNNKLTHLSCDHFGELLGLLNYPIKNMIFDNNEIKFEGFVKLMKTTQRN